MRRLFAPLALVAFAGPAAACINDAELPSHEREFRSQYRGTESPPAPSEPSESYLLFTAGGTFLLGAAALTLSGRRRGA